MHPAEWEMIMVYWGEKDIKLKTYERKERLSLFSLHFDSTLDPCWDFTLHGLACKVTTSHLGGGSQQSWARKLEPCLFVICWCNIFHNSRSITLYIRCFIVCRFEWVCQQYKTFFRQLLTSCQQNNNSGVNASASERGYSRSAGTKNIADSINKSWRG